IHLADLAAHRLGDFAAPVPGVAAPESGGTVQHLPSFGIGVEHAFGTLQHARPALELAVGGEGHPETVEADGGFGGGLAAGAVHHSHLARVIVVLFESMSNKSNSKARRRGDSEGRRGSIRSGSSGEAAA